MAKYKYTRSARIHLTVHEEKVISTRGSRPLLLGSRPKLQERVKNLTIKQIKLVPGTG